MALTEEQREIALRFMEKHRAADGRIIMTATVFLECQGEFLAALPKPEPVGNLNNGKFFWNTKGGPDKWRDRQNYDGPLYAEAPIAQPASAPSEQKAVAWNARHLKTGNIYEVLGEAIDSTNGHRGQTMVIYQRDGKTFVREAKEFMDKFEATDEIIAPQPDYKAQRDAGRYRFLRDSQEGKTIRIKPRLLWNEEIDAAIASVKGGA